MLAYSYNPRVEKFRIAAVGDLHIGLTHSVIKIPTSEIRELIEQMAIEADILTICGDLTFHGQIDEAKIAADIFNKSNKPVHAVLGNHDYADHQVDTVKKMLTEEGGVIFLEDGPKIIEKGSQRLGLSGVKGFGGGFRNFALERYGEPETEAYFDTALQQAEELSDQLTWLKSQGLENVITIMHYSPISSTLEGEDPQLYPYLGSSHLEYVVNPYYKLVKQIFHGHAHFGRSRGWTLAKIPVKNVALPVLLKTHPNIEIPHLFDLIEI